MSQLINNINQGKYDTKKELTNLRNNALRLKNKGVLRAVDKRLKLCFPKYFQDHIEGIVNKKKRNNKTANMSSAEKKRYLNKRFSPDKSESDDIFDRGKVVSGGDFGMKG